MAVRSIIDIQVNDQQWQAFMAMFNKYQAALASTPQQWTAAAQGAQNVQTVTHNVNLQLGVQGNLLKVIQGLQGRIQNTSLQTHRNWLGIATSAKQTAGSILQLGTALLKWGGLGGLVAGIGAGFGVEQIARSAVSRRSEALGLNTGAGQLGGLEAQAGDILDVHGLISRVNELAHSADNTALVLAGVGRDAANRDTSQVAEQAILAIQQQAKAADPRFLKDVFESREIGQLMSFEEFSRLRNLSADEVRERFRTANQAGNRFNLDDATLKKWNDFTRALDTAKMSIEATFIRGLSPLGPSLGNLATAFESAFREITGTDLEGAMKGLEGPINELATELKSQEFKDWVHKWKEDIKTAGEEFKKGFAELNALMFSDDDPWSQKSVQKKMKAFWKGVDEGLDKLLGVEPGHKFFEDKGPQQPSLLNKLFGGSGSGTAAPPSTFSERFAGQPGQPGQTASPFTESPPTAPNDATGTGSEFLRSQRERFGKELEADPHLKEQLAAVISLENEGAGTGVAESLMNRSTLTKASLRQGIFGTPWIDHGKSFYGPVRSGLLEGRVRELERQPEHLRRLNALIDQTLAGSNKILGYTDQGSQGDPNYEAGGVGVNFNRERFNDYNYPGARAFREAQQARVNASVAAKPDTFDSPKQAIRDYHGDMMDALRSVGGEKPGGWSPPSTALGYSDNKPHAVPKYQTNVTIQNNTGGSAISTVQSLPLQEAGGGFQNF